MTPDAPHYDLAAYDFDLPRAMVAQQPADPRDSSRLMVLDRATGGVRHAVFREIGDFLHAGDLLVVNNTRVFPARTRGERSTTGKVEVLFLRDLGEGKWEAMVGCNGNPREGEQLKLEGGRLRVRLIRRQPNGYWMVSLPRGVDLLTTLDDLGRIPLPPYIKRGEDHERDVEDRERYQTVYASQSGAIAAPTAGLHFTPELFAALKSQGVETAEVTLHVGVGTFKPIKTPDVRSHRMHEEHYTIPEATATAIAKAKAEGRRVIAVGTTTCRALEAAASAEGGFGARSGWANIFLYPPYEFRVIDGLVTNFHLPRSTLLLMVSALVGRERLFAAYEEAKREGYRFYSYGDAMLIT